MITSPLPRYQHWSEVPEHLRTRTALRREGLLPGGPERATITYNRGKDETVLYDRREATPKRPLTEGQLLGIEQARLTRAANQEAERARLRAAEGRRLDRRRARLAEELTTGLQEALAVFRDWVADPTVLVLDTETTGLDGMVIEVAAVDVQARAQ